MLTLMCCTYWCFINIYLIVSYRVLALSCEFPTADDDDDAYSKIEELEGEFCV